MRAALLTALVAAGCGGSAPSPADAMSATFANLVGADTSGVAISSSAATCIVGAGSVTCNGPELPNDQGRVVSIAFSGTPVGGMDYRLGGPEQATVLFVDPTTYGTASGTRQWQSVAGTGAIHVVDWTPGTHLSFSYYGSMQPLGSPAAGTFDISGDGNIRDIAAQ